MTETPTPPTDPSYPPATPYTGGDNAGPAAPMAVPAATAAPDVKMAELQKTVNNGGGWFYWIAGLSAVNAVIHITGGEWGFLFGLNITQFISGVGDAFAEDAGEAAGYVALVFSSMIWGVFVMFGYFSCRAAPWAFITGGVLFLLDGLLSLLFADVLGIIFHVLAVVFIFRGLAAALKLRKLRPPADDWITINVPPAS